MIYNKCYYIKCKINLIYKNINMNFKEKINIFNKLHHNYNKCIYKISTLSKNITN